MLQRMEVRGMPGNYSIEGLTEKRNVIRDRVEDAVLKQVSNILLYS